MFWELWKHCRQASMSQPNCLSCSVEAFRGEMDGTQLVSVFRLPALSTNRLFPLVSHLGIFGESVQEKLAVIPENKGRSGSKAPKMGPQRAAVGEHTMYCFEQTSVLTDEKLFPILSSLYSYIRRRRTMTPFPLFASHSRTHVFHLRRSKCSARTNEARCTLARRTGVPSAFCLWQDGAVGAGWLQLRSAPATPANLFKPPCIRRASQSAMDVVRLSPYRFAPLSNHRVTG